MRARLMQATSATVLAILIGSGGMGFAQQATGVAAQPAASVSASLPDGADEGALGQRMRLPELPPAVVDLAPDADVTGSIASPPLIKPTATSATPAALPYDDGPTRASAASADPARDSSAPATPAPTDAAAPATAPVAAEPASTATLASPPPAVPPPPSGAEAVSAHLDGPTIAAALASFATEPVPGDTSAQAGDRRIQREAIATFYASHDDAPLWIADGRLTAAARGVSNRIDHAAEDGLDLARFGVPALHDADAAAALKTELALSEAVLAYARQATGSRVNPARIGTIDLRPDVADAARVLGSVPGAADADVALRAFNPAHPGYLALRDKLAEIRIDASAPVPERIAYGPVLKLGMSDVRVPALRARLGLDPADDPLMNPAVYDAAVVGAVAAFQRTHHMPPSGVLTARTVAALSGGDAHPAARESDILANMELWRWMPKDMAPDRIEVNIPDYKVRVLRDNAVTHETRAVVGQPDKPTPVFVQEMKFIIVNPYWNVPLSIIKNEMMPKLQADPDYFAHHGYETVERDGITYVRQPPGDGNALGRIKFMFPNSHSVYLHDTNARSFFSRDMRALSHGCVRVEEPFSFAEAVMGRDNGWPESRIRKLIGGEERTINLPKPLPIFISYFTAFVDPQDGLQMRDDVYGYAGKVKAALGLASDVRTSDAHPAKRAAAGNSVLR